VRTSRWAGGCHGGEAVGGHGAGEIFKGRRAAGLARRLGEAVDALPTSL
jgi:hypothetical protein